MISLQQMNYIVVLSEELLFQRASERCFVTQPTLSMQIKKAEETLGYAIFDRDSNPLQLTPSGHKLIPILREILAETDKIKLLSEQLKGHVKEEIRIGIIPTIAAYMLPDLFSSWITNFGNVKLKIRELKTTAVLEALEKKELDLAIMAGPYHDARLRSIPLYLEEIQVYCPEEQKASITFDSIQKKHPWLLNQGNCLRTQMLHFCGLKDEQKEDWDYEGGNLPLLVEMVDNNGGYTLIPAHFRLKAEQMSGIKQIADLQAAPAREVLALTPNRSMKMQHIEALIRQIQLFYGHKKTNKNLLVLDWDVA
ncbi:MAG: LysR family transcriptional regulator [Flavobacteriia bacterium]|nr:LysR family transcriptional regulator [Flavobacteriia bacterium]